MTIQRYVRDQNEDLEIETEEEVEVQNVERDDKQFVTVYLEEKNGHNWSLILDQETVDWIKRV